MKSPRGSVARTKDAAAAGGVSPRPSSKRPPARTEVAGRSPAGSRGPSKDAAGGQPRTWGDDPGSPQRRVSSKDPAGGGQRRAFSKDPAGGGQRRASSKDPGGGGQPVAAVATGKEATSPPKKSDFSPLALLQPLERCGQASVLHSSLKPDARLIALYFSASWSPPCRLLTPMLVEAYTRIRGTHGAEALEVVLIPLDDAEEAWREYADTMPWLSLRPADREKVVQLLQGFNVKELPRLLVINRAGDTVSENARGGSGFGFGCDPLEAFRHLESLREAAEEARRNLQEESSQPELQDPHQRSLQDSSVQS